MKIGILAALLVMFLLLGCVEEKQINLTGYEELETVSGTDLTGDGANDAFLYSFASKPIDEQAGLSMKKMVFVYPSAISAKITNYAPITSVELGEIKALVNDFDSNRKVGEGACFTRLGLIASSCTSGTSCLAACTSSTCNKLKEYDPEVLGDEVYSFKEDSAEMNQLVSDINGMNDATSQEEKDELAGKLSMIMTISGRLASNSLFNSQVFGACAVPQYQSGKLSDALSKLGVAEYQKTDYHYKTIIVLSGGKPDTFIELYIKDSPPALLTIDDLSLNILGNGKLYEKEPLTVGWDNVKADTPRKLTYYDFSSQTGPSEDVLSKWKYPSVRERNLMTMSYIYGIYSNPVGQFVFAGMGKVFGIFSFMGYYPALGAAISSWVVIFFLLALFAEGLYLTIRAVMDRKVIRKSLAESFGAPLADWRTYGAVGVGLILLSIGINMFYAAPVETAGLELESVIMALSTDLIGAASAVLFVLGVYTLFLILEDVIKGYFLGKEYYDLRGATKDENLKELAKLRELWQEMKTRVEDLSKTGMVVTEEYAVVVSVPVERLEQMVNSEKQGMAKQLIRFNQERLETLVHTLDEKVNVMNQKWPEWKEELGKVLSENESVPINTLLFIPLQWREWAIEKFISENRAKGYAMEGDLVVKKEIKVGELIEKMVKELIKGRVAQNAVVLSREEKVYTSFPKGKRTVVDSLFIKMKTYVDVLSKKMGATEVRRFVVSGRKSAGVYLAHGHYQAFIITEKAKLKDVIDEWNGMLEKLG